MMCCLARTLSLFEVSWYQSSDSIIWAPSGQRIIRSILMILSMMCVMQAWLCVILQKFCRWNWLWALGSIHGETAPAVDQGYDDAAAKKSLIPSAEILHVYPGVCCPVTGALYFGTRTFSLTTTTHTGAGICTRAWILRIFHIFHSHALNVLFHSFYSCCAVEAAARGSTALPSP